MICTLLCINKNRIIRLFAQLTLPIKYVYHILKGCNKIMHYHMCGNCVESTDMCICNYLILCALSTDKGDIQLQYHPQLNELINQVHKAIVFSVVMQNKKKNWHNILLLNSMKERFYVAVILSFISLTLNLPTTTIVAQPFNVIKWQLKFNPVA